MMRLARVLLLGWIRNRCWTILHRGATNYPNSATSTGVGELGLAKEDYIWRRERLTRPCGGSDDPEVMFRMARAYAPSDAEKMGTYLREFLM